jgi:hypothetical protein
VRLAKVLKAAMTAKGVMMATATDRHHGELMILGSGTTWRHGVELVRQRREAGLPITCWGINAMWRMLPPGIIDVAFNMHMNRECAEYDLLRWHLGATVDELAVIRAGLMAVEDDPSRPLECDGIPMLMCAVPPGAPPTVKAYPIDDVLRRFPMAYFNNGISYMIALALMNEACLPETIHFYGTDYHQPPDGRLRVEAEYERPCQEFWMGMAAGMGVKLSFPTNSNLFAFAEGGIRVMYGYEQCHKGKYDRAFDYGFVEVEK